MLFVMWVYNARFCGEVEFRFEFLGDVRWGESCGELFLGGVGWGGVMALVVCGGFEHDEGRFVSLWKLVKAGVCCI